VWIRIDNKHKIITLIGTDTLVLSKGDLKVQTVDHYSTGIVGSLLQFQRRADDVCGQFADKVSDAERKVDIICDFLCLY